MLSIFRGPRKYPDYYQAYHDNFNFYDGRDAWLQSIANVPEKAVHLFALHWLHIEVYNGGFWQYFYNSTSTSVPEAIGGYKAIGMPEVANIVTDAAALVGIPFEFDKERRRDIVGDPGNRMDFNELNAAFDELADTPKFFRRVPKFVPFADAYAAA